MTEDEMVRWHHRLDGHEFEQTPGVDDGQGGLACSATELNELKFTFAGFLLLKIFFIKFDSGNN